MTGLSGASAKGATVAEVAEIVGLPLEEVAALADKG